MRSEQSKQSISKLEKIRQQGEKENIGPLLKSFSSIPKLNHKVSSIRYPKDISKY